MGKGKVDSFTLGFRWGGTWAGYHSFSIFCWVFVLLSIVLPWLVHDKYCLCFTVSFFLSLSLATLIRVTSAWEMLCLFCETISKVMFWITSIWIFFLKKGVLWFKLLFKEFALFHTQVLDFYLKFIISASWFVIPFIPVWQTEVVVSSFSEILYINVHKNCDLQNGNVNTSKEVDWLETNQEVIGNFITLRSHDFIKII